MIDFGKLYRHFEGRIPCKKGCSICCEKAGDIVLLPREARLMAEKVPSSKESIYRRIIHGQTVELIKLPCPFLKEGLCSIEENRPFDCRIYPFDYCLSESKIIAISSGSCPSLKNIGENEDKWIRKEILNVLKKVPLEWVKSAVLFGPCGNCEMKGICDLNKTRGYNDKEW